MIKRNEARWSAWPLCPQCHASRRTLCPDCVVPSDSFALADKGPTNSPEEASGGEVITATESPDEVLLICPTCDEAFAPQFERRCHACGHDFGTGTEYVEEVTEEMNYRVVLAVAGMLLLAGGLLAFFALALRK